MILDTQRSSCRVGEHQTLLCLSFMLHRTDTHCSPASLNGQMGLSLHE